MADAPKKSGKKYLGLSPLQWGGVGGAALAAWWYLKRRSVSNATAAQTALTGGDTIPVATSSGPTTSSSPATLQAWIQVALQQLANGTSYPSTQAYDDLVSWLNGNCVTAAGYKAIGALLPTLGLPPGYSIAPALSVCPTTTTSTGTTGTGGATSTTGGGGSASTQHAAAPALGAAIAAAMNNNGEHLVSTVFDAATNTWLYMTNKGGIYTETPGGQAGGTYYGSYLGLPASARQGSRSFVDLIANSDGSYTEVGSDGSTYTFNPQTKAQGVK